MRWLILLPVLSSLVPLCSHGRVHLGPSVDPGVFVLTHVGSCRSGKGYCVLGFNCAIDKDFTDDDMGGHCDGLKDAFKPEARFVCCKESENPDEEAEDAKKDAAEILALAAEKLAPGGIVTPQTTATTDTTTVSTTTVSTTTTTTATTTITTTSIVTETVTETYTEIVTMVEEVTLANPVPMALKSAESSEIDSEETLRPGTVVDDKTLVHSLVTAAAAAESSPAAAAQKPNVTTHASEKLQVRHDDGNNPDDEEEDIKAHDVDGLEKAVRKAAAEKAAAAAAAKGDAEIDGESNSLDIKTTKIELEPEKDEMLLHTATTIVTTVATPEASTSKSVLEELITSALPTKTTTAATTTSSSPPRSECGMLGGRGVFEAFGRAAEGILPDLVANWVTGHHATHQMASEFIGGGTVTSTVIYCWMAAVVRRTPEEGEDRLVCTGTLVHTDLIVTSAACVVEVMKNGAEKYKLVLGDSNLNIDLPFGVQSHDIKEAMLHENYKPRLSQQQQHDNDIGLIRIANHAKIGNTVCLLCLPVSEDEERLASENCTVISYGKRVISPTDSPFQAGIVHDSVGILRKADFHKTSFISCQAYYGLNESVAEDYLCASGWNFAEEACSVALDSGSPLVCRVGERFTLAGLVTFGATCAKHETPSVFTKMLRHTNWIQRKYHKLD